MHREIFSESSVSCSETEFRTNSSVLFTYWFRSPLQLVTNFRLNKGKGPNHSASKVLHKSERVPYKSTTRVRKSSIEKVPPLCSLFLRSDNFWQHLPWQVPSLPNYKESVLGMFLSCFFYHKCIFHLENVLAIINACFYQRFTMFCLQVNLLLYKLYS